MAFVTRCPYCQNVWLLPNKETAEKGPVRCARCKHSFDATVNLLQVPDSLFTNADAEEEPAEEIEVSTQPAPSIPQQTVKQLDSLKGLMSDFSGMAEKNPVTFGQSAAKPAEPAAPQTAAPTATQTAALATTANVAPNTAPAPTPEMPAGPIKPAKYVGVPLAKSTVAPHSPSAPASQEFSGMQVPHIIPKDPTPRRSGMPLHASRSEVQAHADTIHPSKTLHILVGLILVIAIILTSMILFNQKILESAPSMRPFYTALCEKAPCPGFFFHRLEAFKVGKTTLVSVGSGGSYNLEVPILNDSDFAQAVPSLELRLIDDNGHTLLATRLTPNQYLTDAASLRSLGPHKTLSVRVNLQTNVTPTKCVVTPVYQ